MKYILVLFFTLITQSIFAVSTATIQEIIYFEQIEKYVDQYTLVVLDLDDTIQIPLQTIGKDKWFYEYYSRELKNGLVHEAALHKTIQQYNKVHQLSFVKAVEPVTPGIIRSIQNRGIHVIALTTRGINIADATVRQLNSIGVSFNNSIFKDIKLSLDDSDNIKNIPAAIAINGIIFCNGNDKGRCLLTYLEQIRLRPIKIIFVDDKLKNLHDVANAVKSSDVIYYGLHYTHLANEQHIDLNVADVQLRHVDEILNDEAAKLLHAYYTR